MAYIYKIENKKNGKMYIGVTKFSVDKRWREHCLDSNKDRCSDRPLYLAMNKYGEDMFFTDIIEEVDDEYSFKREKYWIEYYGTFKNGYNATKGGAGKRYLDYDLIVKLYKKYKNQKKVANILDINVSSVSNVLEIKDVRKFDNKIAIKESTAKPVLQLTLDGNPIRVFESLSDAGRFLGNVGKHRHIGKVCSGKRKTAYAYKWEFI